MIAITLTKENVKYFVSYISFSCSAFVPKRDEGGKFSFVK